MKYKYENINTLERTRDVLLEEINNKSKDTKFVKIALGYLQDVFNEMEEMHEDVRCDKLIEEIVNFLNTEDCEMVCPMCEETTLKHHEYKGSHIYTCEVCAFIGFEFVENKDVDNLAEFLKNGNGGE